MLGSLLRQEPDLTQRKQLQGVSLTRMQLTVQISQSPRLPELAQRALALRGRVTNIDRFDDKGHA